MPPAVTLWRIITEKRSRKRKGRNNIYARASLSSGLEFPPAPIDIRLNNSSIFPLSGVDRSLKTWKSFKFLDDALPIRRSEWNRWRDGKTRAYCWQIGEIDYARRGTWNDAPLRLEILGQKLEEPASKLHDHPDTASETHEFPNSRICQWHPLSGQGNV